MNQDELSSEQVVVLFENGKLIDTILSRFTPGEQSALSKISAKLHNDGLIDLLALADRNEFETLSKPDFFTVQQFLNDAIPSIHADVDRMMTFISKLVAMGENDFLANQPNLAFLAWCKVNPAGAHEVILKARADDPLAMGFLVFALQATEDLTASRAIATTHEDSRRLSALTAIGRIPHRDAATCADSIQTLKSVIRGGLDDKLKATILEAVLTISSSSGSELTEEAIEVVRAALKDPGDITRHHAAAALHQHKAILNKELVSLLLSALTDVNPTHSGHLGFLDFGLDNLMKSGFATQAIDFVTTLLSRPDNRIQLNQLSQFRSTLLKDSPQLFSRTFVRWLLSGEPALCKGLEEHFRELEREEIPLDISMQDLALSDVQKYFVCRKVLGYFFLQPLIAGSVLVSVLRSASDDLAAHVQQLLFDPLLTCYAGKLRKYLDALGSSDKAYAGVRIALARADEYLDGLKVVGEIKELHPSEHQRQIARVRSNEQMQSAMKQAHKQSIFRNLVKRSVLFYGRRSLIYVPSLDQNQQPKAVEMELKSMGVSMEMPRMAMIDATGLEECLFIFRAERLVE